MVELRIEHLQDRAMIKEKKYVPKWVNTLSECIGKNWHLPCCKETIVSS